MIEGGGQGAVEHRPTLPQTRHSIRRSAGVFTRLTRVVGCRVRCGADAGRWGEVEATGTRPVPCTVPPALPGGVAAPDGHAVTLAGVHASTPEAAASAVSADTLRLELVQCRSNAATVEAAVDGCPFLTSLHLRSVSGVPGRALADVVRRTPGLEVVQVVGSPDVFAHDGGVELFGALGSCPLALRQLAVTRSGPVSDECVLALVGADVAAAAQFRDILERRRSSVQMSGSSGMGFGAGAGAGAEAAAAADTNPESGPPPPPPPVARVPMFEVPTQRLQTLCLKGCSQLSDVAAGAIASAFSSLSTLDLSFCDGPALTDAGIAAIVANCVTLKSLDLSGCGQLSGSTVSAISQHCSSLEHLSLVGSFVDGLLLPPLPFVAHACCRDLWCVVFWRPPTSGRPRGRRRHLAVKAAPQQRPPDANHPGPHALHPPGGRHAARPRQARPQAAAVERDAVQRSDGRRPAGRRGRQPGSGGGVPEAGVVRPGRRLPRAGLQAASPQAAVCGPQILQHRQKHGAGEEKEGQNRETVNVTGSE